MSTAVQKFIRLEIETLILDPQGCSEMLEHACNCRGRLMRVTGISPCSGNSLLITLESAVPPVPAGYRFAPIPDATLDGITAELKVRFRNGMTFLGAFRSGSDAVPLWGLYARVP